MRHVMDRRCCAKISMSHPSKYIMRAHKHTQTLTANSGKIASENTFKLPPICLLHDTVIWPKYHFIHITWSVMAWSYSLERLPLCVRVRARVWVCFGARQPISMKCCGMELCVFRFFHLLAQPIHRVHAQHVLFLHCPSLSTPFPHRPKFRHTCNVCFVSIIFNIATLWKQTPTRTPNLPRETNLR